MQQRKTFGRRLRLLRDDLHMTQLELHDAMVKAGVEIGQSYISKLETSDTMPTLEVAAAMARILGATTDYLALLTDDPEPPQPTPPVYISPEADEVARLVDAMPADARTDLLSIARRLARPAEGRSEREIIWWLARVEQAAGITARQALERLILDDSRTRDQRD
jgi:transcriptional regulator with XRE-family HTH domain